jgi:hypothetical protein
MATLQTLRRKAIAAGVPVSKARKASAQELRDLIAANGKPRKASAVKAVRKATRKSAVKKSATRRAPAAKSTQGKAKRPVSTAQRNGKSGRNIIESVNFSKTDGWNPRPGSPPDRIIKALKKAKGNREKAFDALVGDVWDFMGRTKRNGTKRTKAEAQAMLRYRIARTLFDFVIKTGQHKVSQNRIEYGTGENATTATKRKLAKSRAKTPVKRGPGRPKGKRGPGRPKGSKNKPK